MYNGFFFFKPEACNFSLSVNFSYVEVNSVCNIKQEILNEGNSYELYVDSFDVSLLEMCEMWLLVK